MKYRVFGSITVIIFILVAIHSCEDDEHENETVISSYGSDESHRAGENCMTCHRSGGSGEGWFTVAGTVYDETKTSTFANATVRFYTGPDGTGDLEARVEVDQLGNFYTTEAIDFGSGLYVLVEGNELTNPMISKVNDGQCNSCHGADTDRIWTR
jgi:hypothetical protein